MAGELQAQISRLMHKAQLLNDRYALIVKQKKEIETTVEELEKTVRRQNAEIAALKQQIEYMRVTTTLAPSRDDIESTRATLKQLVREINKCINDLNQ